MKWLKNFKIGTKIISGYIFIAAATTLISSIEYLKTLGPASLFIVLFINLTLAVLLGIAISKVITNPLKNVIDLISEMRKGHFSKRLNFNSKDEIGIIGKEIDQFNDHLQKNIVAVVNKISDGEFNIEIVSKEEKDELALAINKIVKTLKELKNESSLLKEAFTEGKTNYRVDSNKFSGVYKEIIEDFNEAITQIITVVRDGYAIMKSLTEGDLTARMEKEYKGNYNWYKDYINNLGNSLYTLVLEITDAVEAASSAANEITSSAEELAAGSEEQSRQSTEIAGAVEEMTKTIIDTTKNAGTASDASKKYGEIAIDGGKVVNETIHGMKKISEVVQKSAATVQQLGKSSEQIGEIIQVIDDIADQTNLLALNAAIEAARAGEQGRGFAVVADEVRKLAERTTKATKEIANMIKQIQRDTEEAVLSMGEGTEEVEKGKLLADKAGESLTQIINGASDVVDIITRVAAASEEQSSASEEISKNIEAISSVTQQSSAGVQQIAKAAEDLSGLTNNLEQLVSRFKISNDQAVAKHDSNNSEVYLKSKVEKGKSFVRRNGHLIKGDH